MGKATRSPFPFPSPGPPQAHIQPQACGWPATAGLLRSTAGPGGRGPRVRAPDPPPPARYPGRRADSPPLAGPGCARPPWLPAGAPKPSSFSMPAISLSCWARKAAAGSSSAASGAPLSDDEKKPKSSAIFPASPPKRPSGARLCPARAPRAPGGHGPVTRAPRGEPLGLGGDGSATGASSTLATGPSCPRSDRCTTPS